MVSMIASFTDTGTKDFYHLRISKATLKTLPAELHQIAKRKLNIIAGRFSFGLKGKRLRSRFAIITEIEVLT